MDAGSGSGVIRSQGGTCFSLPSWGALLGRIAFALCEKCGTGAGRRRFPPVQDLVRAA